jgi:glycosyltransferase A (GT-A) superfamily protein (DUF2064 family)
MRSRRHRLATTLVVFAKSPVAGRVKTRCTPPCTPEQAAALAEAALRDTLRIALSVRAGRHVLALDGPIGVWLPAGFEVVAQVGDGLGERLDRTFADIAGPVLMIGMDTPQVTGDDLRCGLGALEHGNDAVVGLAADGGFWAAGLRRPCPALFSAVRMSRDDTGRRLLAELHCRGFGVTRLPELEDVDDFATAALVAGTTTGAHFALTVAAISAELAQTAGSRR